MQEAIFVRTTLDLPDEVLRKAKIAAVERGFSLRQLVIDALMHEIEGRGPSERQRITNPPLTLSDDAPLRSLSPEEVKRLDRESVEEAELARANALHR
jgi:hypothetical protein